MTRKISQAEARYVVKSTIENERCGLCSMFRKPFSCTDVEGHIKPAGWCKLFYAKADEYAAGGAVEMADGGDIPPPPPGFELAPPPPPPGFTMTGQQPATPEATWNPRTWKPAEGPGAFIADVPRESYLATADAMTGTAQGLNPLSKEHAVQPWDPSKGVGENLAEQAGRQWERVKSAGSGLASAVSVPFAPFVGAARSILGHPLAEGVSASRRVLGEPEKSKAETYEEAKQGVDTAMMAMGPRGRAVTPVPVPPRPAPSGPLGVTLSRGQETGELSLIQREQAALRGQEGPPAQRRAQEFADQQREQVEAAREGIGQQLSRGQPLTEAPGEAGGIVNAEVGDVAGRARALRDRAVAEAEREAQAQRAMVADRERVLGEAVAEGHLPIEAPREAGEIVGHEVRTAAQRARTEYRGLYDEAFGLPGQFHAGAFEGVGNRIQGRLTLHDNPVIIDDVTTPIASRAIRDLDNISHLRIQNRADPFGQPNPENIVAVDLRGVDQARKRLVSFYQAARRSNNPSDARAVGRMIDEFDGQIEAAISNGLFTGDERALGALQQARAAYRRYAQTFRPQQAGDDVGGAIRRIIDRNATPEEIANMVVGSGRIGNAGLPVRIADRLEQILGRDSDAFSAIRQAIWQRASQVRNAAGEIDATRSASAMMDLVESSLGRRIFNQTERAAMRGHAQGIRDLDRTIESLASTRQAERVRTAYQDVFGGEEIGGVQAPAFRRIVEGAATPEETAQAVFGAIGSGNPGNVSRMINAIERVAGPGSETMGAIRQGVWQKLTEATQGTNQPGPQKVSQALSEFLNGRGRTIAEQLYSDNELVLMRAYADLMRQLQVPQAGANWSNSATFVQKSLNHIGSKIGMVIGAAVGHVIAPGMPWGISEGVGAGIAKGVGKIGERSQARVVAKQMPLVTEQIRQWQKAVRAANRANSPYSQRALSLATANLAQSLERIGVRGQAPALQMPAPSRAEENEPSIPRPPGQQQDGGRVTEEDQGFAHGGRANHSVDEGAEQDGFADGGKVPDLGAVDRLPDEYASQNIEDRRLDNTVRGRRLQAIQEQADAADTRQVLRSMKRVAVAR